jgi:cardiolipin synthase
MIRSAQKNIRIIQPYVQNIDELEDVLIEAMEKRGVKLEIITARNRDQPCYKTFLNSYLFKRLHLKGAIVKEEPFKYLHMKAIEVDDGKIMTLGSFNQDHWSFYCNNEANILLQKNSTLANEAARFKAHQQFI